MVLFLFALIVCFSIYAVYVAKKDQKSLRQKQYIKASSEFKTKQFKNKISNEKEEIKIHPQFEHLGIITPSNFKKVVCVFE